MYIPRVGNPTKNKIVIANLSQTYLLSDCVIAIKSQFDILNTMKTLIMNNWTEFSSLFKSTCAPYVTVKQIQAFFYKYGINVTAVKEFSKESIKPITNLKNNILINAFTKNLFIIKYKSIWKDGQIDY